MNNITADDGAVIYSNSSASTVSFTASSLITGIKATKGGALAHFDNINATVSFTLSASTIYEVVSTLGNGALVNAIGDTVTFTFSNSANVSNVSANIASLIYSEANNNNLILSKAYI
jgi:hypothetical protein